MHSQDTLKGDNFEIISYLENWQRQCVKAKSSLTFFAGSFQEVKSVKSSCFRTLGLEDTLRRLMDSSAGLTDHLGTSRTGMLENLTGRVLDESITSVCSWVRIKTTWASGGTESAPGISGVLIVSANYDQQLNNK